MFSVSTENKLNSAENVFHFVEIDSVFRISTLPPPHHYHLTKTITLPPTTVTAGTTTHHHQYHSHYAIFFSVATEYKQLFSVRIWKNIFSRNKWSIDLVLLFFKFLFPTQQWFDNVMPWDLQARSLLSCGLCERLIDPHLNKDYDKDEVQTMMTAARLCILHSSSRRPDMKTVCFHSFHHTISLCFQEKSSYWLCFSSIK